MTTEPRRPKSQPAEPEYVWGDCPAGVPPVLWEHQARPLWAQTLPERAAVLLIEKGRMLCRRVPSGEILWEQSCGEEPDDLAHDVRGVLLAAGQQLRELDPATGTPRWEQRLGGKILSVALDPSTAYVAMMQRSPGPLFALDRSDGKSRWKAPIHCEPHLYPHPEAGLVVVANPDLESVQAYEPARGARLWEYTLEDEPLVVGPLAGGLVLLSAYGRGVVALEAQSGEERWTLKGSDVFEMAGVVVGDTAVFTDGTLWAVDVATGRVRWQRAMEDEQERVFAVRVDGGELFAETWHGRLMALDPASGSVRWERMPGQVHGLTGDERRLYLRVSVPEPQGGWAVLALDRATGAPAWEMQARRMVPDLTRVGPALVVEFKNQVTVLGIEG
jgi:outer membrane protein assembly factor BamB